MATMPDAGDAAGARDAADEADAARVSDAANDASDASDAADHPAQVCAPVEHPPPACSWNEAAFLDLDASSPGCRAARSLRSCSPGGGGDPADLVCLTNDAYACSDTVTVMEGGTLTCCDLCRPGEYAVACSFGSAPPVPGCRLAFSPPTPGGGGPRCCPCE
jgi:hypothetical protein